MDDYFQLKKIQQLKTSAKQGQMNQGLMKNTNPDQSEVEIKYQKVLTKIPREYHVYAQQ